MEYNDLKKRIRLDADSLLTDNDELTNKQKEIVAFSISRTFTMPEFKAVNFVGHSQITPYGALKQYLLEIQGRETAIQSNQYEINKIELFIDREKDKMSKLEDKFDKRSCEIEIQYAEIKREGFYRQLKAQREERLMYLKLIEELTEGEFGKLEDGTNLIDAFDDPKKLEELERDYWIKRLGKQAAMDMIAYGKVGVGNMDSIAMMDAKSQEKTIQLASDVFVWNEHRLRDLVSNSNENYKLGNSSELTEQLRLAVDKKNKEKQ